MRSQFEQKLNELRTETKILGDMVEEELRLALKALDELDLKLAHQVHMADKEVNEKRFSLEEHCTTLISTQQPMAKDLRAILAVVNMIVDLERMGDQAKGIAKIVPHISQFTGYSPPSEVKQMEVIVLTMLRNSMEAYTRCDIDLAKQVAPRDNKVDKLYAQLFTRVMTELTETNNQERIKMTYETLRAARNLERFGDLATNLAERVIYLATGSIDELNVEPDVMIAAPLA